MENIEIKDCLCCWCDLLGYGTPFVESGWELRDQRCKKNYERIEKLRLQFTSTWSAKQVGTKLSFNDGFASTIDITPHNDESYMDTLLFIEGVINDFDSLNGTDKRNGFPGARGILALGQRFSYDSCSHSYNLIRKRTTAYYPKEFQMNTAFSKAFIMEESGSRANIKGSNLFIDNAIFEFLKDAAVKIKCEPPLVEKKSDSLVIKLFSPGGWFADIYLDPSPIEYRQSEKYNNRGIETTLYRYKAIHSVIDEMASEAAYQQARRYSLMEDDE